MPSRHAAGCTTTLSRCQTRTRGLPAELALPQRRRVTLAPAAARFFERQGDRLYHGLVEGFRGESFGGPLPRAPGEPLAWGSSLPRAARAPMPAHACLPAPTTARCHRATVGLATSPPLTCPTVDAGAPVDELLDGVRQILAIYESKGYALKATLTPGNTNGSGATFTVKLEGPANLWSLQVGLGAACTLRLEAAAAGLLHAAQLHTMLDAPHAHPAQALAARRSTVYSQHDAAAVAAFLRASGRSSSCRLAWSDTAVVQQWTLA